MPKGRPGGNPDLVNFQFSTDRDEPCSAKLTLRMQPSQYEKLKQIPEWQEKTREAIAKLLEESQLDSSTTRNTTTTKPAGTIGEGGQIPANGTGQIAEENQTGNTGAKGKGKRSPRARATATKTTG